MAEAVFPGVDEVVGGVVGPFRPGVDAADVGVVDDDVRGGVGVLGGEGFDAAGAVFAGPVVEALDVGDVGFVAEKVVAVGPDFVAGLVGEVADPGEGDGAAVDVDGLVAVEAEDPVGHVGVSVGAGVRVAMVCSNLVKGIFVGRTRYRTQWRTSAWRTCPGTT